MRVPSGIAIRPSSRRMHHRDDADKLRVGVNAVKRQVAVARHHGLADTCDVLPAAAFRMVAEHLRRGFHGICHRGGCSRIALADIVDDQADLGQGAARELDLHRRKRAKAARTSSSLAISPRRRSSSPCRTTSRFAGSIASGGRSSTYRDPCWEGSGWSETRLRGVVRRRGVLMSQIIGQPGPSWKRRQHDVFRPPAAPVRPRRPSAIVRPRRRAARAPSEARSSGRA